MSADPRRQDLADMRQGEPYSRQILVDGDQTGQTVSFTAAERYTPDGDPPLVTVTLTLDSVAGTGPSATSTMTLALAASGGNSVAALLPGVVYIYRIGPDDGPSVLYGELYVQREWS